MPKETKIKSNTNQKLYKKKELYKKNEKLKWEEWSSEKRMDVHFSVTDNHEKLMVNLLNYFGKIDDNKFGQFGWRCTNYETFYTTNTLIGNWNEEQFDIKNMKKSKPLPSQVFN